MVWRRYLALALIACLSAHAGLAKPNKKERPRPAKERSAKASAPARPRAAGVHSPDAYFVLQKELASQLAARDLEKAEEACRAQMLIRPNRPLPYYNMATVHALRGHVDRAMESLFRAIDKGFQTPELLRADPDLAAVRAHPLFAHLVQQAEAKRQQSLAVAPAAQPSPPAAAPAPAAPSAHPAPDGSFVHPTQGWSIVPPTGFRLSPNGERVTWIGAHGAELAVELMRGDGAPREQFAQQSRDLTARLKRRYKELALRDATVAGEAGAVWEHEIGTTRRIHAGVRRGDAVWLVRMSAPARRLTELRAVLESALGTFTLPPAPAVTAQAR